jgi:hypothetical protein
LEGVVEATDNKFLFVVHGCFLLGSWMEIATTIREETPNLKSHYTDIL